MTDEAIAGLVGAFGGTFIALGATWLRDHVVESKRRERVVDALVTEVRILIHQAESLLRAYADAQRQAESNPVVHVDAPPGMRLPDVVYRAHVADLHLLFDHRMRVLMFCVYENAATAERTMAALATDASLEFHNFQQVATMRLVQDWLCRLHVEGRALLVGLGRDVSMYRSDVTRPPGDINSMS